MEHKGTFKRNLGLIDLILIGVGSIIGSGWLFSSLIAAQVAGPSAWISWIIAAFASFFIALTLAELGSAIPQTGGLVRYPALSHGPLIGFLISFAAFITYSCVAGLEAVAVRTYASAWWPALGDKNSTLLGWFVQAALICAFFLLNFWSVKSFGKVNTVITSIKFVVPFIAIVVLFFYFKPENFSVQGFAPAGFSGVAAAVSTAGIMFAFAGFQNVVMFSSEVKNPSRTITLATLLSLLITTVIYMLLQIAFIGAIPGHMLTQGWAGLKMGTPFADLAGLLGLGWLVKVIMVDAILSPAGTGNIYLSATSRQIYAWAKNGTFFPIFTQIDEKSGVPRAALWLSLGMALFWTLPFPSWQALVEVNSAAGVLMFTMLPIAVTSFRRTAPNLQRPYRIKWISVVSPLAFVSATFIIYWVGWHTVSWLLSALIVMAIIYCIINQKKTISGVPFSQQLKSTWWLLFYSAGLLILSYLGSFGGKHIFSAPWDQIVVIVFSLISFYWGTASGLPHPSLEDDRQGSVSFCVRDEKMLPKSEVKPEESVI